MKEIDGVKYFTEEDIVSGAIDGMKNANEKLANNEDSKADGFLMMLISIQTAIVGAEIEKAILGEKDE